MAPNGREAETLWPLAGEVTPSPVALTTPASSLPGEKGRVGRSW